MSGLSRRTLFVTGALALVLFVWLPQRLWRVVTASPGADVRLVVLDDPDEAGTELVVRRGWRGQWRVDGTVTDAQRHEDSLTFTSPGGTRWTLGDEADGATGELVFSVPWSVISQYQTPSGDHPGWRRLDLGADPTGALDPLGVQDLLVMDADVIAEDLGVEERARFARHLGWARLLPADGAMFRRDDQQVRLAAEVPGLVVRRGAERLEVPDPGVTTLLVEDGDVLEGAGYRLGLRLADQTSSRRLELDDGSVVYVPARQRVLSFVALQGQDLDGASTDRITAVSPTGTRSWRLDEDAELHFVGLDRLLGRAQAGPVPDLLPDREFVAAARHAFAAGAAYDHGGFLALFDRSSLTLVRTLRDRQEEVLADYTTLRAASLDPGGPRELLRDLQTGGEDVDLETLLARHDDLALERLLRMDEAQLDAATEALDTLRWVSSDRLDRLIESYNRRLDPAAVGIGLDVGTDPVAGWEVSADGGSSWTLPERWTQPESTFGVQGADELVWLWFPELWRPQDLSPGSTLERRFRRAVQLEEPTSLALSTPTPLEVWVDGETVARLPGDPRSLARIPLEAGIHALELRVQHPSAVVRTALPPGLRLALMTRGAQSIVEATGADWRFSGWAEPGSSRVRKGRWAALVADAGWLRLPDDQARLTPVAEGEERETLEPGARWYVLSVDVPDGGPATLELAAMGDLTELYLDGEPVPFTQARGETGGGAATVSLQLRRGRNTLGIAIRPLRAAGLAHPEVEVSDGVATGVRLASTTLSAPRVDHHRRGSVLDADAASFPLWVVERGSGALEAGTPLVLRRGGEGEQTRLLWFPGEVGGWKPVFTGDAVEVVWTGQWRVAHRERQAASYFHLDREEAFYPYRIRLPRGQGATLDLDRESVVGAGYRAEAVVGHHVRLDAELVAVPDEGRVRALRVEGNGEVSDPGAGIGVLTTTGQDRVFVRPVAGSRLRLYAAGAPPVEVPEAGLEVQPGDRLELSDRGVLLRLDDPQGRLAWGPAKRRQSREELGLDGLIAPGGSLGLEALLGERMAEGRPVRLTVDDDLQAAVREELLRQVALLDSQGPDEAGRPRDEALGVVLDADTGAILAVVSEPEQRAGQPHPAYQLPQWHPGSTFKPVTAIAALRSGDPAVLEMVGGQAPTGFTTAGSLEAMQVPALPGHPRQAEALRTGVPLRNFHGASASPHEGLQGALVASHNTWFGYLSLLLHEPWRQGWEVGGLPAGIVDRARSRRTWGLRRTAELLGFNRTWDLAPGLTVLPHRTAPVWSETGRPLSAGDVLVAAPAHFPSEALDAPGIATAGVGQGEVWATPLAMALVQATLAADGVRPVPRLAGPAQPGVEVLDKGDARVLRRAMAAVVQEGTGRAPFADNPRSTAIVGKTGSAERPGPGGVRVTDSWFTGSVRPPRHDPESDDPARHRLAFAVLIPRGGLGARQAGEAADRITKVIARRYGW